MEVNLQSIEFSYGKEGFGLSIPELHIGSGHRVAFIGPSGSGKTTLINLILGLLKPDSGLILINDEEMDTSIGGNVAMRGSFLIDEEGVVRHAVLNDLPLGRNIDEMLRMIDALAFHTKNGDVCPANWQEGKAAMKASDEGMRKYMTEEADNL